MTIDLAFAFGFNLIVNSLLLYGVVRLVVKLLSDRTPRLKSLFLFLIALKLVIDPFFSDLETWVIRHGMSPCELQEGTRLLSLSLTSPALFYPYIAIMKFSTAEGLHFTLADFIYCSCPKILVQGVVLIGVLGTFFALILFIVKLFSAFGFIKKISRSAVPVKYTLKNRKLQEALRSVQVLTTDQISMPLCFGLFHKKIVIPKNLLDEVEEGEFEAILAHELHHLKWNDGVVRIVNALVFSLFWWIPSKKWMGEMECLQEMGADQSISRFEIPKVYLASALKRLVERSNSSPDLVPCFVNKSSFKRRIECFGYQRSRFSAPLSILLFVLVFFGRFFMF